MTTPENKRSERSRDEVLAGEYVLGVLPFAERMRVEQRLRQDKEFRAIVNRWQENLASLNSDYAESEAPPPWIYSAVEARLFKAGDAASPIRSLWNSVLLWRGLTLVSLSAAILFAANAGGLFKGPTPGNSTLVATLGAENSSISLVTFFDRKTGSLRFTPVAAGAATKSLELWLIEGDNPAIPLGVLPDTGDGEIIIPPDMRNRLKDGVTLAVSLEPFGGSPTGKATGPIVAVGKIGA